MKSLRDEYGGMDGGNLAPELPQEVVDWLVQVLHPKSSPCLACKRGISYRRAATSTYRSWFPTLTCIGIGVRPFHTTCSGA